MFTTIIFLLVLTLLVFIHELGHFLAARLFKIRVDEFAIGFPPRIWSFMRKGTRFAINIVPLGGYVKIHGENPDDSLTPDSILSKPRWQQAVVLIAGVTFNIILTWLLLSLSFMMGTKSSVEGFPAEKITDRSVMVMYVSKGSPADQAGLKPGDTIVDVRTAAVHLSTSTMVAIPATTSPSAPTSAKVPTLPITIQNVQDAIFNSPGNLVISILPAKEIGETNAEASESASSTTPSTASSTVMARTNSSAAPDIIVGKIVQKTLMPLEGVVPGKKAIGISMGEVGTVKLGFFESLGYGIKATYVMTDNIVNGLWQFLVGIFSSGTGVKDALQTVSGPVGIASIVGSSARQGFASLLVITAIISANLAVINLVPFPALDGGRLVVVAIEGTIRRRLNPKVINWMNAIGFLLLIGLMVVVTFKDIFVMFK